MPSNESSSFPSYLRADQSEINKLLQRLSIINAKETEVFHALARIGREKIPYREALEVTNLSNNVTFFTMCMGKFEEAQIAILRRELSHATLEPSYVRLCSESSMEFFAELITEKILSAEMNINAPLPLRSELKKKNISIPNEYVKKFNADSVQSVFERKQEEHTSIMSIPLEDDTFYFTTDTLSFLCETCINRLKLILDHGNVSHILARILDSTLSKFREIIEKNDVLVWHNVINKLSEKMEQIKRHQQLANYPEILHSTIILRHLLPLKVHKLESRHQLEQAIQLFSTAMNAEMTKIDSGLLDQQFQKLMKDVLRELKITEKAELCIKEFLEEHVVANDEMNESNFKSIVKLDQYFIHASLLARIISERYFTIEEKLKAYFRGLISRYLTKSLPPKDFVFFEEEELESSVRQKVMEYDELYYKILKSPILLATTIINHGKQNVETTKSSQNKDGKRFYSVSRLLGSFFDLQSKKMLAWNTIFNLNIPRLGEEAYRKLGFLKRLILIFSGRYKSMSARLRRIRSVNLSLPNASPSTQPSSAAATSQKTSS